MYITVLKETEIKELNDLFNNLKNIKHLIYLYAQSQIENKRNNRLTAEVGSSREKDLIAYMKYILDYKVNYKINNECEEDVLINNRKWSIKHSSYKSLSKQNIKISWTSNEHKQKIFIQNFTFTCDLLIVYVREDNIEVLFIVKEELNKLKGKNGTIFNCVSDSNGRGIGLTKQFFDDIVKHCEFHCKIELETLLSTNEDCIENRVKLLKQINNI